jgi:hypothetical protein
MDDEFKQKRECDYDRDDPARRSDAGAFNEHPWCIGIVGKPPPEKGRRKIMGMPGASSNQGRPSWG